MTAGLYWRAIDTDIHIGYRKGARAGRWLVRWYRGAQKYTQEVIGSADDEAPADGSSVFSFHQAKNAAIGIVTVRRAEAHLAAAGHVPTVGSAVERYMEARDARHLAQGGTGKSDARRRLTRHVLSDQSLCETQLHTLTVDLLRRWAARLPKSLKPSTHRRLANDFKAALNAAAEAERERMPPSLSGIIKAGLVAGEDSAPVARDKQALTDDDIRKVVEAAYAVDRAQDWGGDLSRLVTVLAATGARFSQIRRLAVGDVQAEQGRLMVPSSRKGRGTKKVTHIPMRVGADVIDALRPEIIGRKASEILLRRWRHRQEPNPDNPRRALWVRDARGPWLEASELNRAWKEILRHTGLPDDIVPYSLRHSSIVRQLRRGLAAAPHSDQTHFRKPKERSK